MSPPTISVITVALDCAPLLHGLVDSLLAQEDQDFQWVLVDGGSRDATLSVAERFPATRLSVLSGPDFGIYDALNKGVAAASGDYYLVAGADDRLNPCAIAAYRRVARDARCDLVAASVATSTGLLRPLRGKPWLRGGNAYVASHAVGTLIRRQLHETCGRYSNRFTNCADMHFILSAVRRANARVVAADFVAGTFGDAGISSADHLCSISDAFRIQLSFGENAALQLALYEYRLLRALLRGPPPVRG